MEIMMSILSLILKILVAILIFGLIIFVHELGHFIMAKLMGVKVNEFAMGMGPKLLQFGKKETKYTLRLFPIGGFCSMEGEDEAGAGAVALPKKEEPAETALLEPSLVLQEQETVKPKKESRAFCDKKVWRRVLIVIAGATMNLILGFVLLVVYFGLCTMPNSQGERLYATTTIAKLEEEATSYQSGLRAGDEILKINGKTIFSDLDMTSILQSSKSENGKAHFEMVVRRETDGKKQKVTLPDVTFDVKTDEESGRTYLVYDFILLGVEQGFGNTFVQAAKSECSVALMVWRSLGDIITGNFNRNDLAGPVGTVDVIGDVVQDAVQQEHWQVGLGNLLFMISLITVNVGVFNLLPVPALDGGRLVFLIIEGVTRHKVPAKYEGLIHAIGLILLLVLMVFVTFGDIGRLLRGGW